MIDVHKDTFEYCEDKVVDVPIYPDNSEVEGKNEVEEAATIETVEELETLTTANHDIGSNQLERREEKNASTPTFDFRGKQKAVKPIMEKSKVVEVKTSEATGLGKPKFDFRKGKA